MFRLKAQYISFVATALRILLTFCKLIVYHVHQKSCWLRAGKKTTLETTLEIYLPSFWFKASQFTSF